MRIETPSAYPATSAHTQPVSKNKATANFAMELASAQANASASGGGQVDFSNMTPKELSDWINMEIKSGRMSLDDSSIFVGMTLNGRPVNGGMTGPSDKTQFNFMQLTQGGMEWARQQNDQILLQRLQAALSIMQQYQGTSR